MSLTWRYGVTTVPKRRGDLLPRTLRSLAAAGFDRCWLSVDGCDDLQGWRAEYGLAADRECDPRHGVRAAGVTCRYPCVRAYASWCLALAELYWRDPLADRFAVFQDDVVVVKGLRAYLEALPFPDKGYLNLYLGPWNEDPRVFGAKYRAQFGRERPAYFDDKTHVGFCPGDQGGRGAMALVFDRATVRTLLTSSYVVERPTNFKADDPLAVKGTPAERVELSPRGFKFIDAGVIEALRPLGYVEYVHHPSLVLHTGVRSTIDKRSTVVQHDPNHPVKHWSEGFGGRTFPGEDWDATCWLK